MATRRSKDHTRVVNGRIVQVRGHEYQVTEKDHAEFANLFEGGAAAPKVAGATPLTPALVPAPQGAPAPKAKLVSSNVDREYEAMFGGDAPTGTEPSVISPAFSNGEKVPFDQVQVGMTLKGSSGKIYTVASADQSGIKVRSDGLGTTGSLLPEEKWANVTYTFFDPLQSHAEDPVTAPPTFEAISSTIEKLQSVAFNVHIADIYGFSVQKSQGGFLYVSKTDNQGEELKPSVKKAIAELHPGGYNKKQKLFMVSQGNMEKLATLLDEQGAPSGQAKAKPSKVPAMGTGVKAAALKAGMKFTYDDKVFVVQGAPHTDPWVTLANEQTGEKAFDLEKNSWNKYAKNGIFTFAGMTDGPHVGDTKIEDGVTYVLNANSRWEKFEKEVAVAPKSKAPTLPKVFPFKQIGPQAGSNEGGLYEDAFGKKWYIKFPASEDQAKSEMLAAKLYGALGIGVPIVKMVNKDGKVGIASQYQDGLSKVTNGSLLASQDGVKEGFGADAWLANWDVVGLNYDNLLVGNDGKAKRIDPGGALDYRAQGGLKGEAFGNTVPEIHTLRDASKNPQAASVFGAMTQEQMDASVAKVLEIPDEIIAEAVTKFGPGTEADKKALAAKLIARKGYLAKAFPAANLIANPPRPDPSNLPVAPDLFPAAPDFLNFNGTGKGVSSIPEKNAANQETANQIYALAVAGNLTALKAMTFIPHGGTSPKPMSEHPSSSHIQPMYTQCLCSLAAIENPKGAQNHKDWGLNTYGGGGLDDLSQAFPAHFYGVTKTSAPVGMRLGFWISLGDVDGAESLAPKVQHNITSAEHTLGKASNTNMPEIVKKFMQNVKSSGTANQPYRDGKVTDHAGNNCRDVVQAAYENAAEFQEGATIKKFIDFSMENGMMAQMLGQKPGHIFMNPGSMCCSLKPNWSWSGEAELEIVYAKGAKVLYNIGVGNHDQEGEVTTLPGQRFMVLESKTVGTKGKPWFKLLMMPTDPTYVDNLHLKA